MRKWSRLTADLHLRQIASPLAPLTTQCRTLSIASLTSNHLPTNNCPPDYLLSLNLTEPHFQVNSND